MKYFSFKAGVLAWVCFSLPVSASYAQPAKSLSKNRPEVSVGEMRNGAGIHAEDSICSTGTGVRITDGA